VVVGVALFMFLLGFLVGARTRQIIAKVKAIGRAILSLNILLKIKEAAANGMDSAETTNDGEEDELEEENKKDKDLEDEFLEDFMMNDEDTGLDDHPDVDINPVMMFNIKKAKELARAEAQRALMAAEGLSEEEINERMMMGEAGQGQGDMRPNALAVLIAAGARVEAAKGATSEEMTKKIEMRRKQRNIHVYLTKTLEVEAKPAEAKMRGNRQGHKNAFDIAVQTKTTPVGGDSYSRELASVKFAKAGRVLMREHKRMQGEEEKRKAAKGGGEEIQDKSRRAAGMLDAADFAALASELEEEGGDDDDDEDDGDAGLEEDLDA